MKKTVILGCLKMLPALLILPFVFTTLRAQGSIVYVDGSYTGPEYGTAANPFNTIQEGIDYAVDGDTVLVLPGTYFEALRILNESIRLRSQAGPDATIIEPNPYDPGISVSFDKAANFAIDGFTIRHATWGIDIFFPEDQSVTVRINNNILTENWGGLRLANNYSGAVYDVLITNNQIISNTTLKSYEDVGLKIASAEGSGVITLTNNIIAENTGGISIYSPYSQISFAIVNNTLYGNGVGLSVDAPYLNLVNNILFMNGSPPYNDLDLTQNGPSVTVASNIIGDGQFAGIDGNQPADPLLVSPAQRNFHLHSGSPAIDAGDTFSNTVDFEADGRPYDGDHAGGAQWDIGADEFYPPLWHSAKTVNTDTALPGQVLTYTIRLNNDDISGLADVQLADPLPAALIYLDHSLTATTGSYGYSGQTITWTGSLSSLQVITLTYQATVSNSITTATRLTNTAAISAGGLVFDRQAVTTIQTSPQSAIATVYLPVIAAGSTDDCQPLYTDNFNQPGSGWPTGEDENNKTEYLDGEYRILGKRASWVYGAEPNLTPDPRFSDYIVAVDARLQNDRPGFFGLAFGIPDDWSLFYTFEIDRSGYYYLDRHEPSAYYDHSITLASGESDKIKPGLVTNRLKIERNGSLIRAYVNDQHVASVRDDASIGPKQVGLMMETIYSFNDPPNLDVGFDNYTVYPISCGAAAAADAGGKTTSAGSFTQPVLR